MTIEEMLKETVIHKSNGRRYYKGKLWYRVLWDLLYPESPCKGYDLHHKDFDELNDSPDNLRRLTRSQHIKLHMLNISEEYKKKLSIVNTGSNNPRARAVNINDKTFSTGKEAAKYLHVCPATIVNRIRNKKPGWVYI